MFCVVCVCEFVVRFVLVCGRGVCGCCVWCVCGCMCVVCVFVCVLCVSFVSVGVCVDVLWCVWFVCLSVYVCVVCVWVFVCGVFVV